MNPLNGVWSDTCILKIITQQESQADKDFAKRIDFKGIKFPVKIRDIHKIKKKKKKEKSVAFRICLKQNICQGS